MLKVWANKIYLHRIVSIHQPITWKLFYVILFDICLLLMAIVANTTNNEIQIKAVSPLLNGESLCPTADVAISNIRCLMVAGFDTFDGVCLLPIKLSAT